MPAAIYIETHGGTGIGGSDDHAGVDIGRTFTEVPAATRSAVRCWSGERIYQSVWGYAMAHGDRSVDVFIRKLRKRLEERSPGWSYIHTHFGIGYRFEPEPAGIVEEELLPAPDPVSKPAQPMPDSQLLHESFTGR